jgi:hypothetical protein
MSEWQPIGTCPKDGTMFLGWAVDTVDEFDDEYMDGEVPVRKGVRLEAPVILQWFSIRGLDDPGCLMEVPYRGTIINRKYTHWMLLPPKPTV